MTPKTPRPTASRALALSFVFLSTISWRTAISSISDSSSHLIRKERRQQQQQIPAMGQSPLRGGRGDMTGGSPRGDSSSHTDPVDGFDALRHSRHSRELLAANSSSAGAEFDSHRRELLSVNSWYDFCDTYDGPICPTCQLHPQGQDPCLVSWLNRLEAVRNCLPHRP